MANPEELFCHKLGSKILPHLVQHLPPAQQPTPPPLTKRTKVKPLKLTSGGRKTELNHKKPPTLKQLISSSKLALKPTKVDLKTRTLNNPTNLSALLKPPPLLKRQQSSLSEECEDCSAVLFSHKDSLSHKLKANSRQLVKQPMV